MVTAMHESAKTLLTLNYYHHHTNTSIWDNLCKPIPECQSILGFTAATDDGENWNAETSAEMCTGLVQVRLPSLAYGYSGFYMLDTKGGSRVGDNYFITS